MIIMYCRTLQMERTPVRNLKPAKESMLLNVSKGLEEMEGACRATGISSSDRTGGLAGLSVIPDSEVPEKAVRRRVSAGEAGACKEQGRLRANCSAGRREYLPAPIG
jgi:hypothetical protein